jgi:intraflagellar transport protein 52
MFSLDEFEALKRFMQSGGNVLVLMAEGGEIRSETNLNYFLEEYGVAVNNDCVVRSSFYKYFHPKETLISNGILNNEIGRVATGKKSGQSLSSGLIGDDDEKPDSALNFVYPFGASLMVQKPSTPLLSSGPVSVPTNRPIASFYTTKSKKGRMLVLGSV